MIKKVRLDYNPKSGRFHIDRHSRGVVSKPFESLYPLLPLELALKFTEYAYFNLDTLIKMPKTLDIRKDYKVFINKHEK